MNKEQLKTIAYIMAAILVVFSVAAMVVMIVESTSENILEITELERNYEYCMSTLKEVLPENFDEEKVLGCGITTKLGTDNKCHPLPQM